jgi:hypothetical protein
LIVPVRDREWSKIDIIVGRCRTIDNDRAEYPVTILRGEMRMIPRKRF